MSNYILRKAKAEEIQILTEMSKNAFETDVTVGGDGSGPAGCKSIDWYRQKYDDDVLYAFIFDGELSGGAVLEPTGNKLFIHRIFINHERHRRGTGTILMRAIEESFDEMITFWLSTPEWNVRTNSFYLKCGYRLTGMESVGGYGLNLYEKKRGVTDRLILRKFENRDLEDLYDYLSDYESIKFQKFKPLSMVETKKELEKRISDDEMVAIELKECHKMIGNIAISRGEFNSMKLDMAFNKVYWGHQYGKEAVEAIVGSMFERGVHRVYLECDPLDEKYWQLLESIGFKREAYFEKNVFFWRDENDNPIWKDTLVYAMLNK